MNITPNNNPNRILEPDEETPSPPSSPELFTVQASYANVRQSLDFEEEQEIQVTPPPFQDIRQEMMGMSPRRRIPTPQAVYQFRGFSGIPSGDPDDVRNYMRFRDITDLQNRPSGTIQAYEALRSYQYPNRMIPYMIREQQEREQRNRQRQQAEEKKEEEEEEKEKPKLRSNIRFMR
jgi:hypothetical protein